MRQIVFGWNFVGPFIQKIHLKARKKFSTKISQKTDIFSALCKKTRKCLVLTLNIATIFVFLPSPREKLVFVKQLGSCIGCEDVQATYFFESF
jgi:hypothetical protein